MSFNLAQTNYAPERWRVLLDFLDGANADGLVMKGQVCNRPIGMLFGLQCSFHAFFACPSFRALAGRPLAEIVAAMRNPEVRARLLREEPEDPNRGLLGWVRSFEGMYKLGERPDYLPDPASNLATQAECEKRPALEYVYDALLENDGKALLYFPAANYAHRNTEAIEGLLTHPHTIPGIGDGGAHVGMICDAGLTTHLLTHWTRDRKEGPRIPLPDAIQALTCDTAKAVWLEDRGRLARVYKADINVIDYDRLTPLSPEPAYDLPGGGMRLIQKALGYVVTIIEGR